MAFLAQHLFGCLVADVCRFLAGRLPCFRTTLSSGSSAEGGSASWGSKFFRVEECAKRRSACFNSAEPTQARAAAQAAQRPQAFSMLRPFLGCRFWSSVKKHFENCAKACTTSSIPKDRSASSGQEILPFGSLGTLCLVNGAGNRSTNIWTCFGADVGPNCLAVSPSSTAATVVL